MRWKPAILLVLLLLLSIGGAVFHQHHQKDKRPSFTELDSYLRNELASGDWVFSRRVQAVSQHMVKTAWWNKIGIRPKSHFEMDVYIFNNDLTGGSTGIYLSREDGKVMQIQYGDGGLASRGFKELLCRRFPALRDLSFDP